jgi:Ca2+-binding RTX toxin-like protein
MSRTRTVSALAVAAAVALPVSAQGATIQPDGHTPHRILLQAEPDQTNLLSVEGRQSVVFHDENAPITIAGVPTCMQVDAWTVACSAVRSIDLELGNGPDVAVIDTPRSIDLDAGFGNDRYVALASGAASRVNFAGGPGVDTANYGFATAGVRVAVDLEAGDGRPGDDDVIRRDVETVIGSAFDDVLAGSPRTVQLSGGNGDDRITGGSAEELLSGGDGNDRIDARDGAADTVACGGQLGDWATVDAGLEAAITGCETVR